MYKNSTEMHNEMLSPLAAFQRIVNLLSGIHTYKDVLVLGFFFFCMLLKIGWYKFKLNCYNFKILTKTPTVTENSYIMHIECPLSKTHEVRSG